MAKVKNQEKQQKKKRKSSAGRRSKYFTHVEPKLIAIEGWARDGLIDRQIAHNCGVAYSTFRTYINKHPELAAAMAKGKEVADYEVESALFKRATGYEYEEKTYEAKLDSETGEKVMMVTKVVTKHMAPDTTAAIFWLINRTRGKWMDTRRVEHSGPGGGPMEISSWAELVLAVENDSGESDDSEAAGS